MIYIDEKLQQIKYDFETNLILWLYDLYDIDIDRYNEIGIEIPQELISRLENADKDKRVIILNYGSRYFSKYNKLVLSLIEYLYGLSKNRVSIGRDSNGSVIFAADGLNIGDITTTYSGA